MNEELLPDKLARLWEEVAAGRLSSEAFHQQQEVLLDHYRRVWKVALLLGGANDLQESILLELSGYCGATDIEETRRSCVDAVSRLRGEWQEKVGAVDQDSVRAFYDQSQTMLHELMWWHTLIDDSSPLAYVVALEFAQIHHCSAYLDFGSGVGAGGLLFASNGFRTTMADISSTALKFCSWRFEKRGLPARLIDLKESNLPAEDFDFITAMDVFEHLVDPVATLRELNGCLKRGGYLFGRFHAEYDEERPHHIVLDFEPVFEELKALGFVKVWQDRWLWGHEVFQKSPSR